MHTKCPNCNKEKFNIKPGKYQCDDCGCRFIVFKNHKATKLYNSKKCIILLKAHMTVLIFILALLKISNIQNRNILLILLIMINVNFIHIIIHAYINGEMLYRGKAYYKWKSPYSYAFGYFLYITISIVTNAFFYTLF